MDVLSWMEKIPEEYKVDKRELGKVLLIASAAVFVVSVHSAMTLNSAIEGVHKTNNQLDDMSNIMQTQRFNQSMQALESTDTYEQVDIYGQFSAALKAFNTAEGAFDSMDRVSSDLKESYVTYQWLVLASILGGVAGAVIIYI